MKAGTLIVYALVALSFLSQILQNVMLKNPGITPVFSVEYLENVYIKPWIRMAPYLIGVLLGIKYYNFTDQKQGSLIERH